ncbi:MAG: hypothetical protein IJO11_07870 [Alphaproteobacteria bacterium]|nr:hypothetical protein [Alphaproteobacteria bacterium]
MDKDKNNSLPKEEKESSLGGIIFIVFILSLISQCSDLSSSENPKNDRIVLCQVECNEASRRSDYFDKKRCLYQCEQAYGKFK